jgi:hypothetical protein
MGRWPFSFHCRMGMKEEDDVVRILVDRPVQDHLTMKIN